MKEIELVLNQQNSTIENLIRCLELIRGEGCVAFIKLDGERKENQYTAFISFPAHLNKDIIRADEKTLKEALLKVLNKYISKT